MATPIEEGEEEGEEEVQEESLLTIKGTMTLAGSYQPSVSASMGMLKAESADGCTVTITNQDGVEICTGTVSGGQYECPVLDADLVPAEGAMLSLSTDCVVEAWCCAHLEECECNCGAINLPTTLAVWGTETANPDDPHDLYVNGLLPFWEKEFSDLSGECRTDLGDPWVAQQAYLVQKYAEDNFGPDFKDTYLSGERNMTGFYTFLGQNYGQIISAKGPASLILSLSTLKNSSFVDGAETLAESLGSIINLNANVSGQPIGLALAAEDGVRDHFNVSGTEGGMTEGEIETLFSSLVTLPVLATVADEFQSIDEAVCDLSSPITADKFCDCRNLTRLYTLNKVMSGESEGSRSSAQAKAIWGGIRDTLGYVRGTDLESGGVAAFVNPGAERDAGFWDRVLTCSEAFGDETQQCYASLGGAVYELFSLTWQLYDFSELSLNMTTWRAVAPLEHTHKWDLCRRFPLGEDWSLYSGGEELQYPDSPPTCALSRIGGGGDPPPPTDISIAESDPDLLMRVLMEVKLFEDDLGADTDSVEFYRNRWSVPLGEPVHKLNDWLSNGLTGSGCTIIITPQVQAPIRLRFLCDIGVVGDYHYVCQKDYLMFGGGPGPVMM